MENNKIGQFLYELRKERGLTQSQLAESLNVTHQAVSKWENGESTPDISILMAIAKFYNITVDEILNGERKIIQEKVVNEPVKKEPISLEFKHYMIIARLGLSFLIFVSFFLPYYKGKFSTDDLMPNFSGFPGAENLPRINQEIYFTLTGFHLLYNSQSFLLILGIYTLFLSALFILSINLIKLLAFILKEESLSNLLPDHLYHKVKLYALISIASGALLTLIYSHQAGMFLAILFIIGIGVTELVERNPDKYIKK